MSMDDLDDLWAAEERHETLRTAARRVVDACASGEGLNEALSQLAAASRERFVRPTCLDRREYGSDCDETCGGFHPWGESA
jgi:hypothetical protein